MIILVIKQIGLPLCSRPILLITRMITDRIGIHSVLLPLLIIIIIIIVVVIIITILEGGRGKSLQVTWLNDCCDTLHTNLACSVPFFSTRSSRLSTLHYRWPPSAILAT